MLKKIAHSYFSAFERKDIDKLRYLFDPEVTLKDWDIEAIGKENVLKINLEIFKTFEKIQVGIVSLYAEKSTLIAELIINLGDEITMNVLDIIEFNSLGKITSIRAYKG